MDAWLCGGAVLLLLHGTVVPKNRDASADQHALTLNSVKCVTEMLQHKDLNALMILCFGVFFK